MGGLRAPSSMRDRLESFEAPYVDSDRHQCLGQNTMKLLNVKSFTLALTPPRSLSPFNAHSLVRISQTLD